MNRPEPGCDQRVTDNTTAITGDRAMLKVLVNALGAIVLAALIAGAITGFPQLIEPVAAASPAVNAAVTPAPACPERGWPYNHCGDTSKGMNGARLVGLDRLR